MKIMVIYIYIAPGQGQATPWKRFFKVFTIYGRGGHLGHVTKTININSGTPFSRRLHMKFCFDWLSGFLEEDV